MNKIDALIQQLCPDGVEFKPMGEVGTFVRGSGLQKSDFTETGVGCIHYGQIYTFYRTFAFKTKSFVSPELAKKLKKASKNDLIIAGVSENIEDVCKALVWLGDEDICISGDSFAFKHSQNPKFIGYLLQTKSFLEYKKKYAQGAKVTRLQSGSLPKFPIPIPPIPIQNEIVHILDLFTQLEAELEAELEARKIQYHYYRDALLNFEGKEVEWKTLGEVCKNVSSGGTPLANKPEYYANGTIPWLRTQEVRFNEIFATEIKITELAVKESSAKWIPADCVIIAISGATAARSAINKIPLTTNQHCCCLDIDANIANYRYVFHWVSCNYEQMKSLGQGARADLNSGRIKSFPIPIPPLSEQARIVTILDQFDALVNDLSSGLPAEIQARRQQYEYYRNQLLTFKPL